MLAYETISALNLQNPINPDHTVAIVATHDCDLTQPPEREPTIEVIVGRRINQLDGNYTNAKSARTLHIQFESALPLLVEFNATDKLTIEKNLLIEFGPQTNSSLSPDNRNTFQHWLAARYRRSAFPDEFEKRLKNTRLADKIRNAVRPHGETISAVLFDVDEGHEYLRTSSDETYLLDIYLLYSTNINPEQAYTNEYVDCPTSCLLMHQCKIDSYLEKSL